MPRTRNITREQWQAAVSPAADPHAATIRSLESSHHLHTWDHRHSSLTHGEDRRSSISIGSSLKENYNENENDENRDRSPGKDEIEKKRRKQRPLGDITDIIVHDNRPLETEKNLKGKKRIKRAHHEAPTVPSQPTSPAKRDITDIPQFPSSLPPSSPPPPSNEWAEHNTRFPNEVWDADIDEEEDIPLASDDTELANTSDPFGFFAVERDLKAQRDARPGHAGFAKPAGTREEAGGLILVPGSSPLRLSLTMMATRDSQDPEGEEELISPCATPPTPHKRRRRRVSMLGRSEEEEALLFSPRTESLPSSPSPVKIREVAGTRYHARDRSDFVNSAVLSSVAVAEEGDETVTEDTHTQHIMRIRAKGKGVERPKRLPGKKTRGKRRRESKTPSDPMEFAQRLVDRLPKRRRKKEDKGDEEAEERKELKRKTRKRKPKEDKVVGAVGTNDEREAIRAYFRQVEEYSMLEEKVYVI